MEPSSNEKQRRMLTLTELARAMYGDARPPSPPDFTAEGTDVAPESRDSVPPKPRLATATPHRSARLVLGLGVVEAGDEVSPDLVRSGALDMRTLAAAYQEEAAKSATSHSHEARAERPRFDEGLPTAAATLMLPPLPRRGRFTTSTATVILGALLSVALVAATAAGTLYALRATGSGGSSGGHAVTRGPEAQAPGIAAVPSAAATTIEPEAGPVEDGSGTAQPASDQLPSKVAAGQPRSRETGERIRERDERIRERDERIRERDERIRERSKRIRERAERAAKTSVPAATRACDEQTCLLDPSLACCSESAAE